MVKEIHLPITLPQRPEAVTLVLQADSETLDLTARIVARRPMPTSSRVVD